MTQLIAERKDISFVLFEQFKIESLFKSKKFAEFNPKMVDMIISEARHLAIKEILPTYTQADREGVHFANNKVTVPQCFQRAHAKLIEGEWFAMTEDPKLGGQGLPHIVAQAACEYLVGANYPLMTYPMLAHGAGKMIELYGTDIQKKLFLKKLYSGKWSGSMLLTEAEAGSDVGNLSTSAVKNQDGTWSLSGNKIFITNGDHNLTENIIHPVLARIKGAPVGTKGISLFIAPKIWVNPDGSLGETNDIVCTGIEEKLGLHASPTCSLSLGAKGRCRGLLLGEPNKGMQIMFQMMNDVRLEVGLQGMAHASTAYLYALDYARQRIQGRDATGPVPIIAHPDVRRMLLNMKAFVEGMRSLIYYTAYLSDKAIVAQDSTEKQNYDALIGLLTPVVKSYCSDRGFEVCVQAMQVFGGYGYTCEFPVEQILRDCKIASIYEGANGIQAMDLLGRKIGMNKGHSLMLLVNAIQETIVAARVINTNQLDKMAAVMEKTTHKFMQVTKEIGKDAGSEQSKTAFARALPFLDVMGDTVLGWMHLWRALKAVPMLKTKQGDFYDGVLKTAAHFIFTQLPITNGRMTAISNNDSSVMDISADSFGA